MCPLSVLFSTKLGLVLAIWACFFWWAFNFYASPVTWWSKFDDDIQTHARSDFLAGKESYLIYWGGPPMAITFLSLAYFALPKKIHLSHLKISRMFYSVWGITIVLPEPLGVITFAEILGFIAIAILLIFHVVKHTEHVYHNYQSLRRSGMISDSLLWKMKMEYFSRVMGSATTLAFCLLLFPVSRRSPIMRILGIPYELAIRYHVWLGHTTSFFSTSHSLLYVITWLIKNEYWFQLKAHKFSGLALFLTSIAMWGASFSQVRRKYFEVFYYTHHLYVLYVILYAFHAGGYIIMYAYAGLFIFFLDRLLRFFQSKHPVNVLCARQLPTGYVQIDLPMTEDMETDSLGICFLKVPIVSNLQWHPFSINSHSFEKPGRVTILIKPARDVNSWTFKLSRYACEGLVSTVFWEGPYNSELTYFNRYDGLILVAGGAGITPFRSMLQEVSRLHSKNERAPSFVQLFWVVREEKELDLLSSIGLASGSNGDLSEVGDLIVRLKLFVTKPQGTEALRGDAPDLEFSTSKGDNAIVQPIMPPIGCTNGWLMLFISFFTCLGTLFTMAIFCRFFLRYLASPLEKNPTMPYYRFEGITLAVSFLLGILCFGTLTASISVIFFEKQKRLTMGQLKESLSKEQVSDSSYLLQRSSVCYGTRPNWEEEFELTCENISEGSNVGVFVCGPDAMLRAVAWECQKRSLLTMHPKKLNYHPLGFQF